MLPKDRAMGRRGLAARRRILRVGVRMEMTVAVSAATALLVYALLLALGQRLTATIATVTAGVLLASVIGGGVVVGLLRTSPGGRRRRISLLRDWDEMASERMLTTILFTDIVGSTARAAAVGDRRWQALLEQHDRLIRCTLARFHGREINTTGDGFLATFDAPASAIRCACAVVDGVAELGLNVRVGVHTGECELSEGRLGGIAVNIGARVTGVAAPGEVLVSNTVRELVAGARLGFQDRGVWALKGVPGQWRLFAVERDAVLWQAQAGRPDEPFSAHPTLIPLPAGHREVAV